MNKFLAAVLLFFVPNCCFGLNDTLFIKRDTITVNFLNVSQTTFCESNTFSLQNIHLEADVNEIISLTIVNTDSIEHSFTIDGIINEIIPAGITQISSFEISNQGSYRYYSSSSQGDLVGASGILQIGYVNEITYFWNLSDMNSTLTHLISQGSLSSIPDEYNPDIFTINGFSFPNTLNDTSSYVERNVNDEIYISIANSGNMEHVLHFHGYHIQILDAQISQFQIGWVKDTFPLKIGEAMTVLLIPDQSGIYPVHDHNLIAVTNAGFYPGGMITQLNISP